MSYLVPLALLGVAFWAVVFGVYGDILTTSVKHQTPTEYVLRVRIRGARYDHFGKWTFLVSLTGAVVTAVIATVQK